MEIDVRSAFLLGSVLIVGQSFAIALMVRDLPSEMRPSSRSWYFGSLLQAASYVCYGLQGVAPVAVSVVLANVLFILGLTGYWRSVRQFDGRPDRLALAMPAVLTLVYVVFFTYVRDSISARFVGLSALCGLVFAWASLSLARIRGIRTGASRHLLLAVFASGSMYFFARMFYHLLPGVETTPLLQSGVRSSFDAIVAALLPIAGSSAFLVLCADRVRRSLEQLASTDHLTGLLSRRSVEAAGEIALRGSEEGVGAMSVLLIDVDHFKRVNDTLGHASGDAVIRLIARIIKSRARAGDIVGRWGGEEFIVLCLGDPPQASMILAERIRESVASDPIAMKTGSIRMTVSIGVALRQAQTSQLQALVDQADAALYRAKQAGRNRVELAQPDSSAEAPRSIEGDAGARLSNS